MNDQTVITRSLAALVLFFIFHAGLLRIKKFRTTMHTIFLSIVISWFLGFAIGWWGMPLDIAFLTYAVLYTLLVLAYLVGIFIIADSSLYGLYLRAIAQEGEKGITKERLGNKYQLSKMIKTRIDRLVAAGEIHEIEGIYELTKKFTVVKLRDLFILWIAKLYL